MLVLVAILAAIGRPRSRPPEGRRWQRRNRDAQAQLSKGTLSLQGFVPQKARNLPIAILGGTGDYDGAQGTAVINDVGKSTTDISITFK